MRPPKRPHPTRAPWWALGLSVALVAGGLLCVGAGVALTAWRVLWPQRAANVLPADWFATPPPTPTPSALGTPLPPPPLPTDAAPIVLLPVSERQTPTPSATAPHTVTRRPSATPSASPTPSATPPRFTPSPTLPPPERILIPRIALDAPIVAVGQRAVVLEGQRYSQWDVPNQRAVGWHESSARPAEGGNIVLNGHHNIHGEVFRYLYALEPGDLITLEAGGRSYHYVVVQTMTLAEQDQPPQVRQANARWILPTADERVTLVTCWPYYANTHRLVVIARPLGAVIPPAPIP